MRRYKLGDEELTAVLPQIPGWQIKDGKLYKSYKFATFAQAIGWMVSIAIHADKMDHHPEWANSYNQVHVHLVTHDLGNSISSWDIALAQKMDELAANYGP